MITLRFSMMLRAWRADPRADDWRVEKDKCEMYRFLLRKCETARPPTRAPARTHDHMAM